MAISKKIFLLLGHTDKESFIGALANEYEHAAKEAGFEIRRINLGEVSFDPVLHMGYRFIQELEPDLKRIQEEIKWCDHFVVFYPNWWGTMPACLKGMFDRMYLPGFAFRFSKTGWWWDKLLVGRSATVFISMNTPPWLASWLYGDNSNEIKRNILEFGGFKPVKIVKIGPTERMSDTQRKRAIARVHDAGRKGE